MSRKLIEQYRRRADFCPDNCTPVRLSDGQEWMIQRPWIEVIPIFRKAVAVDCVELPSVGDLDPLLEQIGAEDDPVAQSMLILTLGALLLLRSYDLEDEELSRLFILRLGDPASEAMVHEIIGVATGNGAESLGWGAIADPKARGGG